MANELRLHLAEQLVDELMDLSPVSDPIAARNDAIVTLALTRAGHARCRHTFVLWQRQDAFVVYCRDCLRESQGFVIGEEPS